MANTQVVNQPNLYVDRLPIAWASNTTLTGGIGAARDSGNTYDIQISAVTTINAATNGANGLDTGSLANSTWYAVYVIGDSTNTLPGAYLLSTSQSTPSLPFGYDVFRRVGQVLTNGSAQFVLFFQSGKSNDRRYFWDQFIDTGAVAGTETFTAQSLAIGVPPSSTVALLIGGIVPDGAGNGIFFRRTGSSSTTNHVYVAGPATTGQASNNFEMPCNTSQSIDYRTSAAADVAIILITGFIDNL